MFDERREAEGKEGKTIKVTNALKITFFINHIVNYLIAIIILKVMLKLH